ncbi:hypothetical protein CsatA_024467 [Cannabis sativa]
MESNDKKYIEELPHEIFFNILSRLPLQSLMQCKLVSKHYYTSIKHPLAISMHLSQPKNNHLLCFCDYPKSLDVVYLNPSHENDNNMLLTITSKPILPFESTHFDFDVVGSCNGLVCLYNRLNNNNPLFIFNPFTKEYRELPHLVYLPNLVVLRVVLGFGFHPRTKTYKAIEIVYYMEGNNLYLGTIKETKVYVFNLGEDCQWRCIDQKPHKIITCPSSDVLVNGNLHWLTMRYQTHLVDIVSFDLDKEEFHVIPQPVDFGLNKSLTHLVTLNDRLSAVVSSKFGEHEIWVLKDYNKKESWSKEIVIPDYVPMGFRMDSAPPTRIRFNGSRNKAFRVLCNLQGGEEILFSYRDRCLVSYNPNHQEFKDFSTEGLPIEFEIIVHTGSLIPVDAAFANNSATPSSTLNV